MVYIAWSHEFETGIPGIDYDHRRLVDLLNSIASMVHRAADSSEIVAALKGFHTMAEAHFEFEEEAMVAVESGKKAEHEEIHDRLLDEIRRIVTGYQDGSMPLSALPETLRVWMMDVLTIDAELFKTMRRV
ncbi:MAG: hemerythrin domain-containing protein [Alphaproteobacteria bacterium]